MIDNLLKKLIPQASKGSTVSVSVEDQQQAKELLLKVQDEAMRMKREAEEEARKITSEAIAVEKKLLVRQQQIDEQEKESQKKQQEVEELKKTLEKNKETLLAKLEKAAGLSKDQAKELLIQGWEDKLKAEVAKRIKSAEEEVKTTVEEKAKEMLVDSMRFGATDYVAEYTLSTITLPSEDFKGRIIGKDGRNIRAFELATGVDVDLEEEGVIKLSSFDAVKREIARISLEQLIRDGRIQPERIEEIVNKTKGELDRIMFKAGEELAHKVGVYNLPQEGRLLD